MSTGKETIVGRQVEFSIAGVTYKGSVTKEQGSYLTVTVVQGDDKRPFDMTVSRRTALSEQTSQPSVPEDPLIEAGPGSGSGYGMSS